MARRRPLAASLTLAAGLSLVMLTGCTGSDPANPPSPSSTGGTGTTGSSAAPSTPATGAPSTTPIPEDNSSATAETVATPVRVAVVGDSNSTGHAGSIKTGINANLAWISQVGTPDITYVGGWAFDGASSARMARGVQPVDNADVLVIMAGTNDLGGGVSLDELNANLVSIADTVGAKNVVIAAIPPIALRMDYAPEANADLAKFAASKGWFFHDSWTGLIGSDGEWLEQYKVDGIHTNKAGYGVFGRDMGDFILSTFAKK